MTIYQIGIDGNRVTDNDTPIRTTFTIDGGNIWYDGIQFQNDSWNGFACPMFTIETIDQIIRDHHESFDCFETIRYIMDGDDMVITIDGHNQDVIDAEIIDGVSYYRFMNYSWTWFANDEDSEGKKWKTER